MNESRVERIRARLTRTLTPQCLDIADDSAAHAGHPGGRAGGGHFRVYIVADAFRGRSLLERHRAVYAVLSDLMVVDVHALSIRALTPDEAAAPPSPHA
jgi:BolA family transcriptional regulator, general stress-responsive regulator